MAYTIILNPSSLRLNVGDIDYIYARIVPTTNEYTIAFESNNEDVVKVSSYGVVEAIDVGTTTIKAYLDEDITTYTTITATIVQPEVIPPTIPEYITPKIDWKESDKFNKEDYNRIKNNLDYLQYLYSELNRSYEKIDLGEDIIDYTSRYKASDFNNFEEILETINIYQLEIGSTQSFLPNGVFIDFAELNRIESACIKLHEIMENHYKGRRTLPAMLALSSRDNFFNL